MDTQKFLRGLFESLNPTKPFKPEITTRAKIKAYSPAHLQFQVTGMRFEGDWDAVIHSPNYLTAGGILHVTEQLCEILKTDCGAKIHAVKLLEENREDFEIILDEKVYRD
jgi:hypothetical protein